MRYWPHMTQSGPRVLLVEDDQIFGEILKKRFEAAGIDLTLAPTGTEGIEHLEHDAIFDVILLDISLPDMDGFEVLSRIRTVPALSSVPVIIISNFVQDNDPKWGASMGVEKSVQKSSVMPGDIVEMVLSAYPHKSPEAGAV